MFIDLSEKIKNWRVNLKSQLNYFIPDGSGLSFFILKKGEAARQINTFKQKASNPECTPHRVFIPSEKQSKEAILPETRPSKTASDRMLL